MLVAGPGPRNTKRPTTQQQKTLRTRSRTTTKRPRWHRTYDIDPVKPRGAFKGGLGRRWRGAHEADARFPAVRGTGPFGVFVPRRPKDLDPVVSGVVVVLGVGRRRRRGIRKLALDVIRSRLLGLSLGASALARSGGVPCGSAQPSVHEAAASLLLVSRHGRAFTVAQRIVHGDIGVTVFLAEETHGDCLLLATTSCFLVLLLLPWLLPITGTWLELWLRRCFSLTIRLCVYMYRSVSSGNL